jgi:hypothetical protein
MFYFQRGNFVTLLGHNFLFISYADLKQINSSDAVFSGVINFDINKEP